MHVSVHLQINLKDKSPEHRGITGETWVLGKEQPLELDEMLVQVLSRLAPFYGMIHAPDVLNAQLDEFIAFCQQARFQDAPLSPPPS